MAVALDFLHQQADFCLSHLKGLESAKFPVDVEQMGYGLRVWRTVFCQQMHAANARL